MDLDLMISEADPARAMTFAPIEPGLAAVRLDSHSVSSPAALNHRRVILTGAVAACLGASGLAAYEVSDSNISPAAAALNRMADSVLSQSHSPAPGEYLYTDSQTEMEILLESGSTAPATATFPQRVQTWVSSQPSSGKVVETPSGPLSFSSPQDQAAWEASPLSPHWTTPPAIQGNDPEQPYDVSSLPTDSSALETLLSEGKTGIPQIDSVSGPDPTYSRAALLLFGPATNSSPQLQAAVYKVLASLPGITVSQGQDHLGRAGVVVSDANAAALPSLVINPKTGQPLEINVPVVANAALPSQATGEFAAVSLWTDIVSTSIVNSNSAT